MPHWSFYVTKSPVIILAVTLAILLAGTAKALPTLPAQQQQPSKVKPEPKKEEKKVWTDENIGELGGKSRVSVVGQGKASSTNLMENRPQPTPTRPPPRAQDRYRRKTHSGIARNWRPCEPTSSALMQRFAA